MDELEGYDVTRRRVLFDEIILVSLHREIGWVFVVTMLVILTFTAPVSLLAAIGDLQVGLWMAVFTVLPFVVLLLLRIVMGVDVVTVQGPRSRVRIPFWFRKERAQEVFRMVTRLAREHQERRTRVQTPPPAPPSPLPQPGPPPEPTA